MRSNFRCISSNLTIQICLRRIQCIRSGKFTICICFRVYLCRIGFQSQFCIRSFRINFLCNSSCIISYIGSVCRDFLPLIRCRSLQISDIVFVRSDIACFEFFDLFINLRLGIEMGQRMFYI